MSVIFLETRPTTDERKRRYVPVENDTESPAEKRNKVYEALQYHIPDAIGVLYWKEQQKEMGNNEATEIEDRSRKIPR